MVIVSVISLEILSFPSCFAREGSGFSWDGFLQPLARSPLLKKQWTWGGHGQPEPGRSVPPLLTKRVPRRRRHFAKPQALCVQALETHTVINQSIRVLRHPRLNVPSRFHAHTPGVQVHFWHLQPFFGCGQAPKQTWLPFRVLRPHAGPLDPRARNSRVRRSVGRSGREADRGVFHTRHSHPRG